ncbi:MAG: uroporphyrinogen-III synthase [Pseudohongiellaceae bacterium]|nr:uroporphyrinogen-III synthase [Pseudohongiellaceae bacterium]
MNSLANTRVLLTRPDSQVSSLAAKIKAAQGQAASLPLLQIQRIQDPQAIERVKASVLSLDNYDLAIFISTNAATLGIEWIDQYWPQLPIGLEAYAVGPGTAAILQALPWPVHCSSAGVTSEDLLALPGLVDVKGKRIALFRGVGGRELIANSLRERGARVDYIELYERSTPHYAVEDLIEVFSAIQVNRVVLTSSQILSTFTELLEGLESLKDKEARPLISLLRNATLIVPSERVRAAALNSGFKKVVNAGGADDETVFKVLAQCQSELD